jgi:isopenicillin N synthase-like dioxygenase
MRTLMARLAQLGDRTLQLLALGLRLEAIDAFTALTRDGWHHLRALRYPAATARNVRGMGAHTDYGMLVIVVQDAVGGMFVRPPVAGEARARNWLPGESSAGRHENEEPWREVAPAANTVTVYPGDILQFLTGSALLATPHKVRLNTSERFAFAYFHEPDFDAVLQPPNDVRGSDYIHYGTHFTRMCMRSDPNRAATRRILAERRLAKLSREQLTKAA